MGEVDAKRPRATLAVGDVIADAKTGIRVVLSGVLGSGGMGTVFRGVREDTGEPCAVKGIALEHAHNPKIALRAHFEAQALRELRHTNVVPVFAAGVRDDGVSYMVMPLLAGMTLEELVIRYERVPVPIALLLARDLCLGLHAIHALAVHRDVKPANLHLGLDAVARVLDLGAAKFKKTGFQLTSTGMQVGTFTFMSPEQLEGSIDLDGRSDVWSLGVVLYMLVSGKYPFDANGSLVDHRFQLGKRILDEPHAPLTGVPLYVAQVIDKALAKDREDRYRSAKEFALVLTAALRRAEHDANAAGESIPALADFVAQMEVDLRAPAERPSTEGAGREAFHPTASIRAFSSRAPERKEPSRALASEARAPRARVTPLAAVAFVAPTRRASWFQGHADSRTVGRVVGLIALLMACGIVFSSVRRPEASHPTASATVALVEATAKPAPVAEPTSVARAEIPEAPASSAAVVPSVPPPTPKSPVSGRPPALAATVRSTAPTRAPLERRAAPKPKPETSDIF